MKLKDKVAIVTGAAHGIQLESRILPLNRRRSARLPPSGG
jgi:hypothetical protein